MQLGTIITNTSNHCYWWQFNCIANTFVLFPSDIFFTFRSLYLYIFDRITEIMYRILHYKQEIPLFIRKHVYKISSCICKTRQTNHSSYIAMYNAYCGCRLQYYRTIINAMLYRLLQSIWRFMSWSMYKADLTILILSLISEVDSRIRCVMMFLV